MSGLLDGNVAYSPEAHEFRPVAEVLAQP